MSTESSNEKKEKSSTKENKSGNKRRQFPIKMSFTMWVIALTVVVLLIVFLVTWPNRSIRHDIMKLESKAEIVDYCNEKELDCYYTTLADYDMEGYTVTRVSFLAKDFFGSEEYSEGSEVHSVKKNVYVTAQQGKDVDLPSEQTSEEE